MNLLTALKRHCAVPGAAALAARDAMVTLRCPYCDSSLEAHREDAGQKNRCWHCGHTFVVDLAASLLTERDRTAAANSRTASDWQARAAEPSSLVPAGALLPRLGRCLDGAEDASRQALAHPKWNQPLQRDPRVTSFDSVLKTIAFGALVFVGLPLLVIFVVTVLLAPAGH